MLVIQKDSVTNKCRLQMNLGAMLESKQYHEYVIEAIKYFARTS